MGRFKFEDIIVWQRAMDLGEEINTLSEQFPAKEKFNLNSQICRAVDSIALNIAEGSTGQSNPEFKKFMGYSIRSLAEVVACLHKADRRKYLPKEKFDELYESSYHLMNMMIAFRKNIR
jgi:four helix bundle protein